MELDSRKLRILAAVVDEYIRTGEPVGSKAISVLPDINVSSATIRNDMAMLEQLGLLEQPHTSAGRIPTYNGYRMYIDRIMQPEELDSSDKERLDEMLGNDLTEEALMQNAATALAELTQCAAVVTNSSPQFSVISKVEVIPTGKRLYVILLITSSGSIRNKVCRLQFDLSEEQLTFFSNYMQENLHGVSVGTLSEDMLEKLVGALGAYMVTLSPLVQSVYDASQDILHQDIMMSGEKNLLNCNELDKMDIVRFIEHKNDVVKLLDSSFSGINVMFGSENDSFIIGNSSMIVSKYRRGGREAGSLGVIGPMRVDYSRIIPYIEYLTQRISAMLSDDADDEATQNNDEV